MKSFGKAYHGQGNDLAVHLYARRGWDKLLHGRWTKPHDEIVVFELLLVEGD
jgi:hypothetical protein